jgi:predicted nucleic acid-binding Zn ribbon protein
MADEQQRKKNVRLALILASIAVIFFLGFIARQVLLAK